MSSTIKITLTLTPEGDFGIDAGSEKKDASALDQLRVLMLGIYAISKSQIGETPDMLTLDSLADWADQVMS